MKLNNLLLGMMLAIAPTLAQAQKAAPQTKGTGLNFDMPSYRSIPYKAQLTLRSYGSMPKAASLEKYCPNPGDQGPYSTCVAWAVGFHLRTILWGIQTKTTDKAKLSSQAFSPSYIYEQIKEEGDGDCLAGSNPVSAFELLKNLGVCTNKTLPYDCGAAITMDALTEGVDYTIGDYSILFLPDETDNNTKINTTKKALSENYPVMLCFNVAESFYKTGALWQPLPTDNGPTGQHGRHAMVVVGYDDNLHGGAFRVLNSWGDKWGDKGYVWMKYKDYADYSIGAIQAFPKRVIEPEPIVEVVEPEPAPAPKPVKPEPAPKPVKPVPVPEIVPMSGSVSFVQNTGEAMPASRVLTRNLVVEDDDAKGPYKEDLVAYRMENTYQSGTKFRFFINTNTEAYIYAFATDLTGKVNKILPFENGMSPHIGPNSEVAFPSEKKVVKMDNNKGTDYMLILYSEGPLDYESVYQKMNDTQGGLSQKIAAALGAKLILPSEVKYDLKSIGFSTDGKGKGSVVPLMVELSHN